MQQSSSLHGFCMPDDSAQGFMHQFGDFQMPQSPSGREIPTFDMPKDFGVYDEKAQQQQSLVHIGSPATIGLQLAPATDLMTQQTAMNLLQAPHQAQQPQGAQDQSQQQMLFQQQMQAQQMYQQQLYQQQLYQQQVQAQQQHMMLQNPNAANQALGFQSYGTVLSQPFMTQPEDSQGIGQRVGTVNRWFLDKRSGWIRGDDGINLFVHYTDVLGTRQDLQEGERVSYYLGWNQKLQKQKAELVKPLVEKPLPPQQVTTSPLEGKVTRWDEAKNFGFIAYNTGSVFVHYSDLIGRERLSVGQHVSFEIVVNAACGKHKAVRVSVLEEIESELPKTLEIPDFTALNQTLKSLQISASAAGAPSSQAQDGQARELNTPQNMKTPSIPLVNPLQGMTFNYA